MKFAKLISLILALTLVFGVCAVGFTAFAADGADGTTEEVPVGSTDDGSETPTDDDPVDTPDDNPGVDDEAEEESEGFLAKFFNKLIDKTVRLYNFLMVPIRIIFAGIPMINIEVS